MLSTITSWISPWAGLLAAASLLFAMAGCRGARARHGSSCNSCGQTAREFSGSSMASSGVATPPEPAAAPVAGRQRTCPVTGEELGSMGPPVPVTVAGRTIQVCCAGCRRPVEKNPQKYLAIVDAELRGTP